MKILLVNSVIGFGSTGRIVKDLHEVLMDFGHEPLVAFGRGKPLDGYHQYKIGSLVDQGLHLASSRLFDDHGLRSKLSTKAFVKQVEAFQPDVVHLHNIHGYYLNYPELVKGLKQLAVPVVWTLHDCWSFTGHCAYFDFVGCDRWKTECFDCPQKNAYPESLGWDRSTRNFNLKKEVFNQLPQAVMVSPSNWLTDLVKQSFLTHEALTIPNGIDLEVFKQKAVTENLYNLPMDKKLILGIASKWEPRKGLSYFVELQHQIPEGYHLVLVGLDKQQESLFTSKQVTLIPRTNNVQELVDLYNRAFVLFNPTLEDNFPTVNLEAQACGCPVITFDTGGSPETISERTGRVINKSIDAFLQTLFELDLEPQEALRALCRQHALNFDKQARYLDYLNLYEKMMKT